jgi:GTP-binding protein LepA
MTTPPISNIRNFSVVAHIDHGKSTLSDRLIQFTGGLTAREMSEQVLDNMDIEKERGITIKAQTVRLNYRAKDGQDYVLNLMDTPGHVDFAYEVSRSLAACEGSLLVVDASQGVEAQTLANVYQAIDNNHEIVPVLNKVDLPAAEPERVRAQIEDVIGIDASEAVLCSAKSGIGIEDVLEAIVTKLPAPKGDPDAPLKAMLVDAWYDPYLGVVVLVRVFDGVLKTGMRVKMMRNGSTHLIDRVGVFLPKNTPVDQLGPGEVGFITAQIKEVAHAAVGDTITDEKKPTAEPLKGFKEVQSVVFCGLFPVDAADFEDLRAAIGKLRLNDASFTYEMESSAALGFGFRCGFLGLLHLEIIQERLSREFNLDLIATAPSVVYKIGLRDGSEIDLHNPADLPDVMQIETIRALDQGHHPDARRISRQRHQAVPGPPRPADRTVLRRRPRHGGLRTAAERGGVRLLRPSEVDLEGLRLVRLRDHRIQGRRPGEDVILVNAEPVDALSMLVHRARAETRGRGMVEKMKELIPPHLFVIPIQAAIGGKIIARETVRALRKDVTSKCYGGDATRKKKLLEKQKAGKKKMRQFGKVEIPQEAFIAALKMDED